MVTARFKVTSVVPMGASDLADAYAAEVTYTPDYAQGRNAEWSEATPNGVFRLTVTNRSALSAPEMQLGAAVEIQLVMQPAE